MMMTYSTANRLGSTILERFPYQEVTRKPNPMRNLNPLAQTIGKRVTFEDRIKKLALNKQWQRTIEEWKNSTSKIAIKRKLQVAMVRLGDIEIDEDIQRLLDEKHCSKIASPGKFDLALAQVLYCIKTSKGKFINVDGQHTGSTIAGLIDAGLIEGDWRDFEVGVAYIETDDLAFARKAFKLINGQGKKRISKFMEVRTSCNVVRIDKNTDDPVDVEIEKAVSIAESFDCYMLETKSPLLRHPGTFSHIAKYLTLANFTQEMACKWHNDYFHYVPINGALWFIMDDIVSGFNAAKLHISDQFLEELAAIVQNLFSDLEQYHAITHTAYNQMMEKRWGYRVTWREDSLACFLISIYEKLGGREPFPKEMAQRYEEMLDFLPEEIQDII